MLAGALPDRRGVEADAVVDDAHVQAWPVSEMDADALSSPVAGRVRHGLPDDPEHRLPRRDGELDARGRARFDGRPGTAGRLRGDAPERIGQGLVGRPDERGDRAARLVEGPVGRGLDVANALYFTNWKSAVRGLPSPRSGCIVLHELAYVVGVFQLNW